MKLEQIDTSTTAGKAEVMRLAAEGRKVASRAFQNNYWFVNPTPSWNWQAVHYSIIVEPTVVGVYCDGGAGRAQFEAWAFTGSYDLTRDLSGAYVNQCTHYAWRGWQECDIAYRASSPMRGFEGAFYELAGMLNISAQPRSPQEVWETQMRPMLRHLIAKSQPHAVMPFEATALPEGSREAAMVVLERDASGRPTVWCDPGVVDLVRALNAAGIATVWSCDGHGHRPATVGLKDGRQLLVLESLDALTSISHLWPGINGEAQRS